MGRSSKAKNLIDAKKVKCDGRTDGRTDGQTDGRTDKAGCRVALHATKKAIRKMLTALQVVNDLKAE